MTPLVPIPKKPELELSNDPPPITPNLVSYGCRQSCRRYHKDAILYKIYNNIAKKLLYKIEIFEYIITLRRERRSPGRNSGRTRLKKGRTKLPCQIIIIIINIGMVLLVSLRSKTIHCLWSETSLIKIFCVVYITLITNLSLRCVYTSL